MTGTVTAANLNQRKHQFFHAVPYYEASAENIEKLNKKKQEKAAAESTDKSVPIAVDTAAKSSSSKFVLEPIGPVFGCVTAVQWDYSTGHCAVMLDSSINILKLDFTDDATSSSAGATSIVSNLASYCQKKLLSIFSKKNSLIEATVRMTLFTLCCIPLDDYPMYFNPSLSWSNGQLFVSTPFQIKVNLRYVVIQSNILGILPLHYIAEGYAILNISYALCFYLIESKPAYCLLSDH
jgi:hypothetical protein